MLDLFKSFVDLGAIVVLPILIFFFGVAFGYFCLHYSKRDIVHLSAFLVKSKI